MSEGAVNEGIKWRIPTWYPKMDPLALKKLKTYSEVILEFSRALNLISARTTVEMDLIHFADCIEASSLVMENNSNIKEICDIGSGNGFPGIVLSILYPSVKVVLLDSDERKCEFLKSVKSRLVIENVVIEKKTVESLPEGSLEFGISRGFASITKAIVNTRKQFKPGGIYYHMKSENWASEVSEIPTQLFSSWNPGLLGEYRMPSGGQKFAVIKTDKI